MHPVRTNRLFSFSKLCQHQCTSGTGTERHLGAGSPTWIQDQNLNKRVFKVHLQKKDRGKRHPGSGKGTRGRPTQS